MTTARHVSHGKVSSRQLHFVAVSSRAARGPGHSPRHLRPGAGAVAEQLAERGVATKEVVAEEWGQCVVTQTRPVRVNIAVANVEGSSTRWQMFAFVERGLFQLATSPAELQRELANMREHLAAIVAAIPDAREVSWEEPD